MELYNIFHSKRLNFSQYFVYTLRFLFVVKLTAVIQQISKFIRKFNALKLAITLSTYGGLS